MKSIKNKMTKNFLKKYRNTKEERVKYIPLKIGFLKLEYGLYDIPEILSIVSFVLNDKVDAIAIGPRLELNLNTFGSEEEVTYITENGISGLQWSDGRVFWGHTYDDDSPPPKGRKISLGDWIDKCIDKMINPDDEEIDEQRRLDSKDKK